MDIAAGVVGRGAELATLQDFVSGADTGVGCLVLEGAAGAGKTALWESAVAMARGRGTRVLACRPSSEEARFDFSGLADLFADLPDTILADLPVPQSRALEAAMLLGDGTRDADVRAVSAGTLSVVRSLVAANDPLVIALDDVQWLDSASAGALTFALRRLRAEPVRVLATRRVPGSTPSMVERVMGPTVLPVAPMSLTDISRLLQSRLGVTFSRATSRRIYERSAGNPLFALELARVVIDRGGRVDAADDLPLPAAVESALAERLRTRSPRVRRALLVTELAGAAQAIELDQIVDADSIDEAVQAGVITVTDGRIRPAHPLLGAAAVATARPAELRELHHALSAAALDAEHAARHLALARRQPDERTAAIVAGAAEQASRRGAAASAAELGEYALRLTPRGAPAWAERLLTSAQYRLAAGELGRVRELLGGSVGRLPDATARARALIMLVDADQDAGSQTTETPCLVRALTESEGNPRLRSLVYQRLTMHGAIAQVTYIPKAAEWAEQAVRLAAAAGDPAVERTALTRLMWARAMRAQSSDAELARYRMLADVTASDIVYLSADRVLAVRGIWRGELADSRASLNALLALAEARGEAESHFVFRLHLCELEVRAGRWQAVRALLDEWAVEQEEPVGSSASHVRVSAQLAVGLGQVGEAKRLAAEAIGLAVEAGTHWHRLEGLRALGMAESLAGEYQAAAGHLAQVWEHTLVHGIADPGVFPVAPDLVEARAAAGDIDGACEVAEAIEAFAASQDHPWAVAAGKRCRGLVLLAQRQETAAADALEAAADQFAKLDMPFEWARTLVSLGITRRRLKRLLAGREALAAARRVFTELGSDGWAARAAAELDRFGGRRTAAGLTPTEERVAGLVANGLSNKLVARELVVSVSAVERHLTRIYDKLGVASRAELIRRRAVGGEPAGLSGRAHLAIRPRRREEHLAHLGEDAGHLVLLPHQLVDLTLGGGAAAVGLRVGLGEYLSGLCPGLAEDLFGLLPGLADEHARVALAIAPGRLRLRGGGRRPLLGVGGPPFRLGDQCPCRGVGVREPFDLGALGLLAARGELHVEIGFRLRPQRLALLEQELLTAPDLVGLALGRRDDLIPFPRGGRLQRGRLALSRRPHIGRLVLGGRAPAGHFPFRRGPQPFGVGQRVVGTGPRGPRGGPDLVGFGPDGSHVLGRLFPCRREQLLYAGRGAAGFTRENRPRRLFGAPARLCAIVGRHLAPFPVRYYLGRFARIGSWPCGAM